MKIITGFTDSSYNFTQISRKYQTSKEKLADKIGINPNQIKNLSQNHSDQIIQITEPNTDYSQVAGHSLFTTLPNVLLMVLSADCVPILFWDKDLTICGAIHLSRMTVFLGLLDKTLELIKSEFHIKMENLQIEFGVSLQSENHLLLESEAKKFPPKYITKSDNSNFSNPNLLQNYLTKNNLKVENVENLSAFELDLPLLILDKLVDFGVNLQNIKTNQTDTFSDPNYHSYRRDYPHNGLIASFVMIEK